MYLSIQKKIDYLIYKIECMICNVRRNKFFKIK